MPIILILYNVLVVPIIRMYFWIGGIFNTKIKAGYLGRKNQWQIIEKASLEIGNRKVVLIHAASINEWLQAQPLVAKLKAHFPSLYVVVSFLSPTGFAAADKNKLFDLKIYLPIDSSKNATRLFTLLQPELWLISKFDIWPNHLFVAGKRAIKVVMTTATLSKNSKRNHPLAKYLYKRLYHYFDLIFPISNDDYNRFLEIFPYPERLIVAGDTDFDLAQLLATKSALEPPIELFNPTLDHLFTIALHETACNQFGKVLPAVMQVLLQYPNFRLVILISKEKKRLINKIGKFVAKNKLDFELYSKYSIYGFCESRIAIVDDESKHHLVYRQTDVLVLCAYQPHREPITLKQPLAIGLPVVALAKPTSDLKKRRILSSNLFIEVTSKIDLQLQLLRLYNNRQHWRNVSQNIKQYVASNSGAVNIIAQKIINRYFSN